MGCSIVGNGGDLDQALGRVDAGIAFAAADENKLAAYTLISFTIDFNNVGAAGADEKSVLDAVYRSEVGRCYLRAVEIAEVVVH
jgi:hypothetical protein